MNRRDSLKTLLVTTAGAGLAATGLNGCGPDTETGEVGLPEGYEEADPLSYLTPKERAKVERLNSETFYTEHEMATLTKLAHLILPPNEHGSIEDAKVPEFIEFRTKDVVEYQLPMRGGLMWLDRESGKRFDAEFIALTEAQQKSILDDIAFYDKKLDEDERPMEQNWFALVRNLVVTGYYTSPTGYADLNYQGNAPNVWDGVPPEVLAKHGVSYDPVWIAKCVDQEARNVQAEWDEAGNLVT